jgi:pilus assembly protein Flp/PilA
MRVKLPTLRSLIKSLAPFFKDEGGATAIEYALIVGLIFLAIVTAVTAYTQNTNALYQHISNAVIGSGG